MIYCLLLFIILSGISTEHGENDGVNESDDVTRSRSVNQSLSFDACHEAFSVVIRCDEPSVLAETRIHRHSHQSSENIDSEDSEDSEHDDVMSCDGDELVFRVANTLHAHVGNIRSYDVLQSVYDTQEQLDYTLGLSHDLTNYILSILELPDEYKDQVKMIINYVLYKCILEAVDGQFLMLQLVNMIEHTKNVKFCHVIHSLNISSSLFSNMSMGGIHFRDRVLEHITTHTNCTSFAVIHLYHFEKELVSSRIYYVILKELLKLNEKTTINYSAWGLDPSVGHYSHLLKYLKSNTIQMILKPIHITYAMVRAVYACAIQSQQISCKSSSNITVNTGEKPCSYCIYCAYNPTTKYLCTVLSSNFT